MRKVDTVDPVSPGAGVRMMSVFFQRRGLNYCSGMSIDMGRNSFAEWWVCNVDDLNLKSLGVMTCFAFAIATPAACSWDHRHVVVGTTNPGSFSLDLLQKEEEF